MDPRAIEAEEKRIRRLNAAITELLTTEFTHRANLVRMIEISRDPEFRKHFPAQGALLQHLDELARKTEDMLAVIYRGTPWEHPSADDKALSSEIAAALFANPEALRQFISLIPNIAAAQIECNMLANLYNANSEVNREKSQQIETEKRVAKAIWEREKKAPPPTITNDFMTYNPILFSQRFPRYLLTLKELTNFVAKDDTATLASIAQAIEATKEITAVSNSLTGYLSSAPQRIRDEYMALFKNWDQPAARDKVKMLAAMLDKIHTIDNPDIKRAANTAFKRTQKPGVTNKKMIAIDRLLNRMNIISTALSKYASLLQPETRDALIDLTKNSIKIDARKEIRNVANAFQVINGITDPIMQMAAIKVFELAIAARQFANPLDNPALQQLPNCCPALAILHQCTKSANPDEAACAQTVLQLLPQSLQSPDLATRFQNSDLDPRNQFYQTKTADILNMPARDILFLISSDPLAKEKLMRILDNLTNENVLAKLEQSSKQAVLQLVTFIQFVNNPQDAARNPAYVNIIFNSTTTMGGLLQQALTPAAKTALTPQLPRHAVSDSALAAVPKRTASVSRLFSNPDRDVQKIIEKNAPELWEAMKEEKIRPQKSFSK